MLCTILAVLVFGLFFSLVVTHVINNLLDVGFQARDKDKTRTKEDSDFEV